MVKYINFQARAAQELLKLAFRVCHFAVLLVKNFIQHHLVMSIELTLNSPDVKVRSIFSCHATSLLKSVFFTRKVA